MLTSNLFSVKENKLYLQSLILPKAVFHFLSTAENKVFISIENTFSH